MSEILCARCADKAEFLAILDYTHEIVGHRHHEQYICGHCRNEAESTADEIDAHENRVAERHGVHYGYCPRPTYKEIQND